MKSKNNIYFASDLHLGAPDHSKSLVREKHFVKWLDSIKDQAAELYLVGDVFDFWFEYKHAVPKGYVRLLGKLAELADRGTQIHIFSGNHDLWYKDYLSEEFGAIIHFEPIEKEFFGKKFYLAHGDGLGPGDHGYKFMKKIFTHPINKWLYARLHPNAGISLARFFSGLSRNHNYDNILGHEVVHQEENEFLYAHAKEMLKTRPDINVFVFGHRHMLVRENLGPENEIIILGDWIQYFSFLEVDESGMRLNIFPTEEMKKMSLNQDTAKQ